MAVYVGRRIRAPVTSGFQAAGSEELHQLRPWGGSAPALLARASHSPAPRVSECAESEHASVQVLASLLTIGPEQKSAALRARCSNVAPAATRSALLLRGAAGPERKRGVGLISRRGGPWFVKAAVSPPSPRLLHRRSGAAARRTVHARDSRIAITGSPTMSLASGAALPMCTPPIRRTQSTNQLLARSTTLSTPILETCVRVRTGILTAELPGPCSRPRRRGRRTCNRPGGRATGP
jgi:hypothetical protein